MATKNLYLAITEKTEYGTYHAFVVKVSDNINLASYLKIYSGMETLNIWPKKYAEDTVRTWNEEWEKEGIYTYTKENIEKYHINFIKGRRN